MGDGASPAKPAAASLSRQILRPQVPNYNACSAKLQVEIQNALLGKSSVQDALNSVPAEPERAEPIDETDELGKRRSIPNGVERGRLANDGRPNGLELLPYSFERQRQEGLERHSSLVVMAVPTIRLAKGPGFTDLVVEAMTAQGDLTRGEPNLREHDPLLLIVDRQETLQMSRLPASEHGSSSANRTSD